MFFDYNGNGVQDGEEPPVAGAAVQLGDEGNSSRAIAEAVTDSSGEYKLEDARTGACVFYVSTDHKFRYMCRSREEFVPVAEGYHVLLDRNERIDVGLTEGFLTLPFNKGTRFRISNYVDLDPSFCPAGSERHTCPNIRDWRGGKPQTFDGHGGIDFIVPENTPILAPARGVVAEVGYNPYGGNHVVIDHGYSIKSSYGHLNKYGVSVGQQVSRGETIALSGNTGDSSEPHLHFEMRINDAPTDPYRDLLNPDSKSLWTVDNVPQFP